MITRCPNFIAVLLALVLLAMLAAASAVVQAQADPAPTTRPIGVWYQPRSSHQKWAQRGVNLMIGYVSEGHTVSADDWCRMARTWGHQYILQDTAECAPHWADAACLAVMLSPDEPQGGGNVSAGEWMDNALALRKRTSKPLAGNFDLWTVQYESDAEVAAYCGAVDWIYADWYLAAHGDSPTGKLESLPAWTMQLDRLRRLAPGKRVTAFIECSDQRLYDQKDNPGSWVNLPDPNGQPWWKRMHGPSVYEMQGQHDAARAHGCEIAWFPDVIGKGWIGFDGTTDELAGAMKVLNSR